MFLHHAPCLERFNIFSTDTPNGRIYTGPDGTRYWSMTTMLSKTDQDSTWYEDWVAKVGKEFAETESKRCCDRGEVIHKASENYINNFPLASCMIDAGSYRRLFVQIKRALDGHITKVYGTELPVFSKLMKVGGRLDLVAEWGGEIAIIDYKGSNWVKGIGDTESYAHQLCGYSLAFEEMYGLKAKKLINIIANERSPTPTIIIRERKDIINGLSERIKRFHQLVQMPD